MKFGSQNGEENSEEFSIDPDFAIYNEEGEIIGQFDDDGNEIFLPGKNPVKDNTKPEGAAVDPAKKTDSAEDQKNPKDKSLELDNEGDKDIYFNHAHFILKKGGYDLDEIEFENGEKVLISELTPEQQLNIITAEFEKMQQEYESELTNAPKPQEFSEETKALVDFLENGGTARDLAKYIMDNDPDNAHKNLTDDQLVLENMRKSMPGATEEDLQEEFKILKDAGRIEKRAQMLRNQLASGEIKLSDISQKHAEIMNNQIQRDLADEIQDAKNLTEYAKKVTDVAGVPVDPTVINSVLKNLIPEKPGEESSFLKSLNSPEKLLRYQFLDQYAEKIMEHVANESMKEGVKLERERLESRISELEAQLNIKNKHLAKFSDEPIVSFSKTRTISGKTEPVLEEF